MSETVTAEDIKRARRLAREREALRKAVRVYLATNPSVFRLKPVGAPGSAARMEQDDKIAAEDALLAQLGALPHG